MPEAYRIPTKGGGQMDEVIYEVLPANEEGSALRVQAWNRTLSLSQEQASAVGRQAWERARRSTKSGGCVNCYWHGKRARKGDCSELCCILRETAAANGVEINPSAFVPVQAADVLTSEVDGYLKRMLFILPLTVFCVHYLLADRWQVIGLPLLLLILALAGRRLYYYY